MYGFFALWCSSCRAEKYQKTYRMMISRSCSIWPSISLIEVISSQVFLSCLARARNSAKAIQLIFRKPLPSGRMLQLKR